MVTNNPKNSKLFSNTALEMLLLGEVMQKVESDEESC